MAWGGIVVAYCPKHRAYYADTRECPKCRGKPCTQDDTGASVSDDLPPPYTTLQGAPVERLRIRSAREKAAYIEWAKKHDQEMLGFASALGSAFGKLTLEVPYDEELSKRLEEQDDDVS